MAKRRKKARAGPDKQRPYPKADLLHRGVARFVDLMIAVLLARLLPEVGALVAVAYLLLGDGLMSGQSLGKKLGGVRAVNVKKRQPAAYRESALRNLPIALVGIFYVIPIIGWVLFPVGGLFVLLFESYMAWTDRLGLRIGDVFADTQVIDASVPFDDPEAVRTQPVRTPVREMPEPVSG